MPNVSDYFNKYSIGGMVARVLSNVFCAPSVMASESSASSHSESSCITVDSTSDNNCDLNIHNSVVQKIENIKRRNIIHSIKAVIATAVSFLAASTAVMCTIIALSDLNNTTNRHAYARTILISLLTFVTHLASLASEAQTIYLVIKTNNAINSISIPCIGEPQSLAVIVSALIKAKRIIMSHDSTDGAPCLAEDPVLGFCVRFLQENPGALNDPALSVVDVVDGVSSATDKLESIGDVAENIKTFFGNNDKYFKGVIPSLYEMEKQGHIKFNELKLSGTTGLSWSVVKKTRALIEKNCFNLLKTAISWSVAAESLDKRSHDVIVAADCLNASLALLTLITTLIQCDQCAEGWRQGTAVVANVEHASLSLPTKNNDQKPGANMVVSCVHKQSPARFVYETSV